MKLNPFFSVAYCFFQQLCDAHQLKCHYSIKAALKTLVSLLPVCDPKLAHAWEDVLIGSCLQKRNILPFDTRDGSGAHRYHPIPTGYIREYRPPPKGEVEWYHKYNIDEPFNVGLDAVAESNIAFHYVSPDSARRMHAIFYHGYCQHSAE